MAIENSYLKGISEGTVKQITDNEILDKDKIYIIDDIQTSITNEQMQAVLDNVLIRAAYNANDIFVCIDSGTYAKNHIYKFTGNAWEDITVLTESDNKTITKDSENKLQTVAITDGIDTLTFAQLYENAIIERL